MQSVIIDLKECPEGTMQKLKDSLQKILPGAIFMELQEKKLQITNISEQMVVQLQQIKINGVLLKIKSFKADTNGVINQLENPIVYTQKPEKPTYIEEIKPVQTCKITYDLKNASRNTPNQLEMAIRAQVSTAQFQSGPESLIVTVPDDKDILFTLTSIKIQGVRLPTQVERANKSKEGAEVNQQQNQQQTVQKSTTSKPQPQIIPQPRLDHSDQQIQFDPIQYQMPINQLPIQRPQANQQRYIQLQQRYYATFEQLRSCTHQKIQMEAAHNQASKSQSELKLLVQKMQLEIDSLQQQKIEAELKEQKVQSEFEQIQTEMNQMQSQ